MKNIQNFDDFNNEPLDEGWRNVLGAGLLSLMSFGAFGKGNINKDIKPKEDSKEITTTRDFGDNEEYKQSEIKRLLKSGWKQSGVEIDTLWEKTREEAPDTMIHTISMKIGGNQFFKSGDFVVSDSVKNEISHMLQEVLDNDGILTNVVIEASTDKQGLSPRLKKELTKKGYDSSNAGLSKLRADGIKDYLTSGVNIDGDKCPINDSLIQIKALNSQGDTVDATKRYVKVDVQFMINPKQYGSEQERKFKTKTTYTFSKTVDNEKDNSKVKVYKKSSYKYNSPIRRIKLGNIFRHKNRSLLCPKW